MPGLTDSYEYHRMKREQQNSRKRARQKMRRRVKAWRDRALKTEQTTLEDSSDA